MVRFAVATTLVLLGACSRDPVAVGSGDTSGSSGVDTSDDTFDTVDDSETCHLDPCCGDPCCNDGCGSDHGPYDDDGPYDDTGPEPGPCDDVDCGAGVCVLEDDGLPSCECDEGYAAIGLTCVACVAIDETYDIDVPLATVVIQPTLNGEPFPATASQSAELELVGHDGDRVELGDTTLPELTASVVPGQYRLVYHHVAGADVPQNSAATVALIDVVDDAEIAIDILSTPVSGTFYFDGAVAPASASENGRIALLHGADVVELGETRLGDYEIQMIPGEYLIEYGWLAGEEVVPANQRAIIGVVEVPWTELIEVAIDIGTTMVDGAITITGEIPPESTLENGMLSLVGTNEGDVIQLGETRHGSFARRVVPGEYSVIYEHLAGGSFVPLNSRADLGYVDVFDGSSLDVDIPMAAISVVFTLDGAVPPPPQGSDGNIVLSTALGDLVNLGSMSNGSYAVNVVAGDYDVHYRVQQGEDDVYPRNDDSLLAQIAIDGDENIDIDVSTVTLAGEVTIDGAPPPVMGDGGAILLRDPNTEQTFPIAQPGESTFSVSVLPGAYDLMYAAAEVAVVAPMNDLALIGSLTVDADMAVAIDVPVRAPFGAITIDGAAPGANAPGELALDDLAIAELDVPLAAVADGNYWTRVTPGSYLVRYRGTSDEAMPANENAPLTCIAIQ